MIDSLSRGQKIKKAKEEADKQKRVRLAMLYKRVFDETEEGREVFRDLMAFCQTFTSTMTGNSWTYFNEGKRAVGLHILERRELGIEAELTKMRTETYTPKKIEEE